MKSNGFLLNIEKLARILNGKLPEYSKISCVLKSFNDLGVNEVYMYANYGFSKYQIAIWVGNSEYFEYDNSEEQPYKFDVRIESESELCRCCEYEFEHLQDFNNTIDTAIKWIEKTLKDLKMRNYVCVTEDAYKLLVSTESKDKFVDKTMVKVYLTDEDISKKMKSYKMDVEEKKIRIIKPIFEKDGNKIIDISVLTNIENNIVTWNR